LRHAYALARWNAGAPGVDGVTFADIELSGRDAWLAGLRDELVFKTSPAQSSAAGEHTETEYGNGGWRHVTALGN
jgi:hypothetical protein